MQTPIYKCPDCGAKVIFNVKKNSYKCQKCGQGFSENDVFIQGMEEWKADEVPMAKPVPQEPETTAQQKVSSIEKPAEPQNKVEYTPSDDYSQKKNKKLKTFLKESDSLIKSFCNARIILGIFYTVEAILLIYFLYQELRDIIGILFLTSLAMTLSVAILNTILVQIRSKIIDKAVEQFDEIKSRTDKGMICGGKSCNTYFKIPDVKEGDISVNYKCFINNQYLSFNDIKLGYWTEGKNPTFEVLRQGWGLRKSHKLANWYFMMIYKKGFPSAPNTHTFSCKDYLGEEELSDFKVRVSDTKALSEWKINNLKTVLKHTEKLLGNIPFAIAIENRYTTIMFITNRETFIKKTFENYDKDTVSSHFLMLHDLVEMAKIISSIEVEEDFDVPQINLPE